MIKHTPAAIKAYDSRFKTARFAQDALQLACLAEDRGRDIVRSYLAHREMGDPDNPNPTVLGVIPRLGEILSTLYRGPASRRLKRGDVLLGDDDPSSKGYVEVQRRALLDSVMSLAEYRRAITKQALISFVENHSARAVQARCFWPFEVFRYVTPACADDLEADEAIALCLDPGDHVRPATYQLYQRGDSGAWSMWIVDEGGRLVEAPYGEEGVLPGGVLPLVMTYDALPCGSAYLQIPEGRLDAALSVSALANDLAYIVKTQAHSVLAMESNDPEGVRQEPPSVAGPQDMMVLPLGAQLKVIQATPQITAIVETIDSQLSYLAIAESLPPDSFSKSRAVLTGPAWRAAHQDLESRRIRQVPLALEWERRAFSKMRVLHNAFVRAWGVEPLPEDVTLSVSFARMATPSDVRETQDAYFKDLYAGAASLADYVSERFMLDRSGALEMIQRVNADRAEGIVPLGNTGAMADGPHAALGEGSATVGPGSASNADGFNPDPASASDGASVVDAMVTGNQNANAQSTEVQNPAPAPAPSSNSALLDLEVGKLGSALEVLTAVTKGELARESAREFLQLFLGLTSEQSDRLVGQPIVQKTPAPEPAQNPSA